MKCRHCGADVTLPFVDLGAAPPSNAYLDVSALDAPETHYPLKVMVCQSCWLVQTRDYTHFADLFAADYAYFSSFSTSWLTHAERYVDEMCERFGLGTSSQVIEVAANDGYLLQYMKARDIPCLGIEPTASTARAARQKGLEMVEDFFGVRLATQLRDGGFAADLMAANNVLAHVPDINDFVAGFTTLLTPQGVATFEFPHLLNLVRENQFDTIYHEHFSYLSAVVIDRLAKMHGLSFVDVEELPSHGGSLRIYLAHEGSSHAVNPRVPALIAREERLGFRSLEGYAGFSEKVEQTKRALLSFLIAAKNDGKRICGYGAPGKGNTLLNYCGIGPDFLDFTVDRNPYKHGRFTPGTHIPIRPVEAIDEAKPDLILILPWNLTKEIVHQMRHVADWGAKFVIPIPTARIIDPAEIKAGTTATVRAAANS